MFEHAYTRKHVCEQGFIFWRHEARRASEEEEACRKERKERKGKGEKEREERKGRKKKKKEN